MWYYTDLPNPQAWSENDNPGTDSLHESFKVRWDPWFSAGGYNVEVEFWDAYGDPNTNTGSAGRLNVASYITWAWGHSHLEETWLASFCYQGNNNVNSWLWGCS